MTADESAQSTATVDDTPTTGPSSETEEPTSEHERQPAKPEVPLEVQRALRKANKEAEGLRLKLKEYEDRDKTETQRLEERATTAEQRAVELEAKLLRLEVAAEKGLTAKQARRLAGATREELEADADDLVADLKPAASTPTPPPDARQGVRGQASTPPDGNQWMRRVAGRA